MKTSLITFLLAVFFMPAVFGQELISENQLKQETYLLMSHRQKKTGWILLGAGGTMTIVGLAEFANAWDGYWGGSSSGDTIDFWGYVTLAGLVASASSIPFFISSGVNKRRAIRIGLSVVPLPLINPQMKQFSPKPQPGIKIAFYF